MDDKWMKARGQVRTRGPSGHKHHGALSGGEADTEGHVFYDPAYVRCLAQAKPDRKMSGWQGTGNTERLLLGTDVLCG